MGYEAVITRAQKDLRSITDVVPHRLSRIKSEQSFIEKMLIAGTSDITYVQDIVAITIVRPTIGRCYETLAELCDIFEPYYKLRDTLQTDHRHRSLDLHLRGHGLSFEAQIRTPELQKIYEQTHAAYKEMNCRRIKYIPGLQESILSRIERCKGDIPLFDMLCAAVEHPQECFRIKDYIPSAASASIMAARGYFSCQTEHWDRRTL